MRLLALLVVGILSCAAGFVAGTQSRSERAGHPGRLILPHLSSHHDPSLGYIEIRGTWEREDKDDALPNQTTTMQCWRAELSCIEVTAAIADTGFMPLDIHRMKVTQWTDNIIIICGSTGFEVSERYRVDLIDKTVTGTVGPKISESGCPSSVDYKMHLIDGYYRSLPELKKALDAQRKSR